MGEGGGFAANLVSAVEEGALMPGPGRLRLKDKGKRRLVVIADQYAKGGSKPKPRRSKRGHRKGR